MGQEFVKALIVRGCDGGCCRLRICSFLASGTEIAYALGLSVQGRSDCCDYPVDVLAAPVVIRSVLHMHSMRSAEIDSTVLTSVRQGQSLYEIDLPLLERLQPELILTQDLCAVCAVPGQQVLEAVQELQSRPIVLSLSPHTLEEIFTDIERVGAATGRTEKAGELTVWLRSRVKNIVSALEGVTYRPRLAILEWIDPPIAAGHWVPELARLAGGLDDLVEPGAPALRLTWQQLADYAPDIIVVAPCGFTTERTIQEAWALSRIRELRDVPALRDGRIYAVDARAYYSRHGPRVVDGLELLAHILHPDRVANTLPPAAIRRVAIAYPA